ncbi:hypothetical protein BN159_0302 [Streptomyces davaonensis JCM 4913]|uniref:Uncharacterized protein n=1 Tax=Streptomyces davaonensis (strain DSM 101723 / JCM 4913 / KCC S-0913 / 768) TaxID=1214101 RepID=K4QSH9_STRDJ|nr:hypothetical protein BN159_0302 [Streptomyces davaonensis JCM 4913]
MWTGTRLEAELLIAAGYTPLGAPELLGLFGDLGETAYLLVQRSTCAARNRAVVAMQAGSHEGRFPRGSVAGAVEQLFKSA